MVANVAKYSPASGCSVASNLRTVLTSDALRPVGKIPICPSGKYPTDDGSAPEEKIERPILPAFVSMCSILLVEDHPDTQRAFAAILRSWGHDVATSYSAAAGLEFLAVHEVDAILSDIGLPDQNGYDFIAQVRREDSQVTAIAVSAYFTAADQERGREAGFDMHFSKPVDLLSLRLALARIGTGIGRDQARASDFSLKARD
jgi:CheY-like chemotaxis protein